nr:MAG TPA: hypothetical protein [Herelleviridae sp.]
MTSSYINLSPSPSYIILSDCLWSKLLFYACVLKTKQEMRYPLCG